MKSIKNDETTRIETPRSNVPRPTMRPIPDDEAKTQFFVVPSKRIEEAPALEISQVSVVEEAPRRARNSFPEPPRNRPRVFDRPQTDVTTLRPSRADESTQLRPQMHEAPPVRVRSETRVAPIESSVVVALDALQPARSAPPPVPARTSTIPSASPSVPALEMTVEIPSFKRMSPIRIAALSMAAVLAPFACVVAFLGSADAPMTRAAAAMPPAVAQAVSMIASTAIAPAAPVAAPVAVAQAPQAAPEPKAAAIVSAPIAYRAPPPVARPTPMAVAMAAAPAPRPIARVAAAPAAPAAKPKAKGVSTELPDAQAADALARAQLEAALR